MNAAFALGGLVLVVPALIVLGILVVVSARGETDPTGRRPYALYLCAVVLVTVFTALFASFAVVHSLVDMPVNDRNGIEVDSTTHIPQGQNEDQLSRWAIRVGTNMQHHNGENPDDRDLRTAVQAGLVTLAAAVVLLFHLGRLRALTGEAEFKGSAAWRVHRVFVYAVAFVAVLTALFAAAAALYDIFRVIAPGVTQTDGRGRGWADFASSAYLAVGATLIFLAAWNRGRTEPPVAEPPPPAPPPPEPS